MEWMKLQVISIKLGGQSVLTYLTNIFNNIFKTKQIPGSWHEAKIVILFKTASRTIG